MATHTTASCCSQYITTYRSRQSRGAHASDAWEGERTPCRRPISPAFGRCVFVAEIPPGIAVRRTQRPYGTTINFRPSDYESRGREFESLRARHFGIRYRRQDPPILRHEPSGCIGWSNAPRDLCAVLALDHRNVVLTLQIKPELRAVSKIVAKPHRGVSGDRPAPVEYVRDTA